MLSYQHEYHAGNHADVLKHAVLALVIRALQRKEAALRVLDAHAGSGLYDLAAPEARRNAEAATGIGRVLARQPWPAELAPYLEAVRVHQEGARLRRYPGSPAVARHLLRPQDQLALLELHGRALTRLRRLFARDAQVHIHARDSFEGLPALLPPPERRGVVLVDPAYEVKDDFARVAGLLAACYRRFPTGVYQVWYPLIPDPRAARFPDRVAALGMRRILRAELSVLPPDHPGMRGSALLLVNPPYGLEAQLAVLLPWLAETLAGPGAEPWRLGWLVPE